MQQHEGRRSRRSRRSRGATRRRSRRGREVDVMAVFAYTALDRQGRQTSGHAPRRQPRGGDGRRCIGRGLSPVSIEEQRNGNGAADVAASADAGKRRRPTRVSQSAVEVVHPRAGEPAGGGLAAVARAAPAAARGVATRRPSTSGRKVHDDVVGGTSLADALAKWPQGVFAPSTSRWSAPARRAGSCPSCSSRSPTSAPASRTSRARSRPRWSTRACWRAWRSAC